MMIIKKNITGNQLLKVVKTQKWTMTKLLIIIMIITTIRYTLLLIIL